MSQRLVCDRNGLLRVYPLTMMLNSAGWSLVANCCCSVVPIEVMQQVGKVLIFNINCYLLGQHGNASVRVKTLTFYGHILTVHSLVHFHHSSNEPFCHSFHVPILICTGSTASLADGLSFVLW